MSSVIMMGAARAASGRLERLAWVGLAASLVALAIGVEALCRAYRLCGTFGPQDLTAWTQAICTSIGLIAAAANGLAVVIHRWGKAPKKPRKRPGRRFRPDPPTEAAG